MVICNVAKILELVIPLMEHPSETFLATIEEDLMKLIIKYGMTVYGSLSHTRLYFKKKKSFCEISSSFLCLFFASAGGAALCQLSRSCCQ